MERGLPRHNQDRLYKGHGTPPAPLTIAQRAPHVRTPRLAADPCPHCALARDTVRPFKSVRVMEREADDAHLHSALNPALLEEEASELNTLLKEGDNEEVEEAAAATTAAEDRSLVAASPADVDVARRVVARWRAFVVKRTACPLLDLLQALPDLFEQEVLKRLDPTARTMLAQVGRPWRVVVLAAAGGGVISMGWRRRWLPRLPKGVTVRLQLREFCTSAERLAWAKANGCRWDQWTCQTAAEGGHLKVLQWAREHDCLLGRWTCAAAAGGGHLEVLKWLREHGCPWDKLTCEFAAHRGHLEVLKWAVDNDCPWNHAGPGK